MAKLEWPVFNRIQTATRDEMMASAMFSPRVKGGKLRYPWR
jgi:hypothetical protein